MPSSTAARVALRASSTRSFHFRGAADADDGHAPGQLGQTLLQLFLVVVGGGVFDLTLDLRDAAFDVGLGARAVDDGGVVLGDGHLLGLAEHFERDVLELDAEIFADQLAAGEHGDVFKHGLAAIAEARSLDGRDAQTAAELVDHQGGQGLAVDVFGHDHQGTRGLHDRFQHRQQRLQRGELLLIEQDQRILENRLHLVGVGDEVGRQIAAVELHAFDDIQFGVEALGFLDRDHAFIADLFHGLGDHVADLGVAIGGNAADLGDFLVGGHLLGARLDVFDDLEHGLVDAALQIHRVHAGGDGLGALDADGLSQDGGGGGAVAGLVVGLGGDFADQLSAQVFELVGQLDFLGDGDAVLGRARRAERLFEDDVAALGTQRHLDGVGEDIDAAQHAVARVTGELDFFGSHDLGSPGWLNSWGVEFFG